ncbi:subtilisin-like protein [Aaosphaeria arxii CBS 175.79]|uniref:Subtilisin-like protein n=1 Tax=Aaosphaeria arxii CBS 175.79 TaxID=1450172 RepID=A0A6A5XJW0_9PLEO|nr:subtilisin-like protein [Aaosphaeria arxii CBS 175.79]KAF2013087.1 subtilisin-like protein [Aaosphaeria arxii CBS 175.79]
MKLSTSLFAFLASITVVSAAQNEGYISKETKSNAQQLPPSRDFIAMYNVTSRDAAELRIKEVIEKLEAKLPKHKRGLTNIRTFSNNRTAGAVVSNHGHEGCMGAVADIAEVAMVEEAVDIQSFVTQKINTTWGLQRISNSAGASGNPVARDYTYSFEDEQLGAGVDIYVVDTGVRKSHAVFTGRAQEDEFSFNVTAADGDGHGTHCAGTAAGARFGVAQGANVFAVKVLGDDGSGSSSDTILGIDWVINNHEKRKQELGDKFVGSIMSMSWGLQGTAEAVDRIILGASEAGIHISVAAGNDGTDACLSTPSHNGGANSNVVTVGSVNIQNQVSGFSNIGPCVDIYAPGEDIVSSWNTGDNIINTLSGTSMACPHTTGVMAYLMAQDKSLGQNPAALKAKLLETARKNAFVGNTAGSANLLLSNGVDGGVTARRLMKNYVVPKRDGKRSAGGSFASWASNVVRRVDEKWELHSAVTQLRF